MGHSPAPGRWCEGRSGSPQVALAILAVVAFAEGRVQQQVPAATQRDLQCSSVIPSSVVEKSCAAGGEKRVETVPAEFEGSAERSKAKSLGPFPCSCCRHALQLCQERQGQPFQL
mmetsp:Transcript_38843/g.77027  ORF Transcript_38843/g.77027 Transcript_38843/m.77027 type:complete len:115 (-) Transcript_38843:91-435(-)